MYLYTGIAAKYAWEIQMENKEKDKEQGKFGC